MNQTKRNALLKEIAENIAIPDKEEDFWLMINKTKGLLFINLSSYIFDDNR
jgi:hypothetical protein